MVNKVKWKGKEVAAFLPAGNNSSGNLDRNLISRTSPAEPSRSGTSQSFSPCTGAVACSAASPGKLAPPSHISVISASGLEIPYRSEGGSSTRPRLLSDLGSLQYKPDAIQSPARDARKVSDNFPLPNRAAALGVQQPVEDPPAVHNCCGHYPEVALCLQNPGCEPTATAVHFCCKKSEGPAKLSSTAQAFENAPVDALTRPGRSYAAVVSNKEAPEVNCNATNFAGSPSTNFAAEKGVLSKSFHEKGGSNFLGQILESEGRKIVSFSDKELDELAAPFEFALVGKFSHGCPTMKTLRAIFGNFNLTDRFSVSLLEQKHVLIRLSCEEDYTRLWSRQVWYMAGFPMRVLKWTPEFDPLVEAPFAPVWVQLPYLPVHLFDRRSLFKIVSVLGKPLRLDSATAAISRPSCARVCIEIDLTKSPLSEVEIHLGGKMRIQEVEYENFPDYCSVCYHIGHDSKNCKVSKPPVSSAFDPSLAEEFVQIPAPVISPGEIDTSRGPEVGTILISGNGKCVLVDDSYSTPSIPLNTRALREDLTKSMDKFPLFQLGEISGPASVGDFIDGQESATEDWYSEDDKTRIEDPPYTRHMAKLRRKKAKDEELIDQGRPRAIIPYHTVFGSVRKFYKYRVRREKRQEKNKANSVYLST